MGSPAPRFLRLGMFPFRREVGAPAAPTVASSGKSEESRSVPRLRGEMCRGHNPRCDPFSRKTPLRDAEKVRPRNGSGSKSHPPAPSDWGPKDIIGNGAWIILWFGPDFFYEVPGKGGYGRMATWRGRHESDVDPAILSPEWAGGQVHRALRIRPVITSRPRRRLLGATGFASAPPAKAPEHWQSQWHPTTPRSQVGNLFSARSSVRTAILSSRHGGVT